MSVNKDKGLFASLGDLTADTSATPQHNVSGSKFDLAALAVPQDFSTQLNVETVITSIHVGKPSKHDFIRIMPNWTLDIFMLDENRESFAVLKQIALSISEDVSLKRLHPAITRKQGCFLWPIKLPDTDGKLDNWNRSAFAAAQLGKTSWIRIRSDLDNGCYSTIVAKNVISEPVWPELTKEQWIELAFKGKIIDTIDHPALKRLRGEI